MSLPTEEQSYCVINKNKRRRNFLRGMKRQIQILLAASGSTAVGLVRRVTNSGKTTADGVLRVLALQYPVL